MSCESMNLLNREEDSPQTSVVQDWEDTSGQDIIMSIETFL